MSLSDGRTDSTRRDNAAICVTSLNFRMLHLPHSWITTDRIRTQVPRENKTARTIKTTRSSLATYITCVYLHRLCAVERHRAGQKFPAREFMTNPFEGTGFSCAALHESAGRNRELNNKAPGEPKKPACKHPRLMGALNCQNCQFSFLGVIGNVEASDCITMSACKKSLGRSARALGTCVALSRIAVNNVAPKDCGLGPSLAVRKPRGSSLTR